MKLFNAIQSGHLATQGVPAGTAGRRALPIAGDDAAAKATVTALTDEIGYDVVDAGPLAEGWRFDRDQPAYGPEVDAAGLTELLGAGEARLRLTGRPRWQDPGHGRHGVRQLRRDDAVGDLALAL